MAEYEEFKHVHFYFPPPLLPMFPPPPLKRFVKEAFKKHILMCLSEGKVSTNICKADFCINAPCSQILKGHDHGPLSGTFFIHVNLLQGQLYYLL